MLVGTASDIADEWRRRQADTQPIAPGDAADDDPGQHQLVGCGDRRLWCQGNLELIGSVLGVELLDRDTGHRRCCDYIAHESLMFEYTGQAVLRPQRRRQSVAVRVDKEELDFVPDHRLDSGCGEGRLDPAQRSAAARGNRRAVLLEE